MLSLFPELKQEGIDFVDVGCSGQLDAKWHDLSRVLNYTGFDPNEAECQRLSALPSPYRKTQYLPFAIDGSNGQKTLFITKSPYCSSLLKPRHGWLNRFSYHSLFDEVSQATLNCCTLDKLAAEQNLSADILKIDTQGLELPILQAANRILPNVFCVEVETGFVENYFDETVYAKVDAFLRAQGFLLFDIIVHRVGRDNPLGKYSRQQPLWCESIWLRDYLAEQSWGIPVNLPRRHQALAALCICDTLGFYDYGLELARYFREHGLLDSQELATLSNVRTWSGTSGQGRRLKSKLLLLTPRRWRLRLYEALTSTLHLPSILNTMSELED